MPIDFNFRENQDQLNNTEDLCWSNHFDFYFTSTACCGKHTHLISGFKHHYWSLIPQDLKIKWTPRNSRSSF